MCRYVGKMGVGLEEEIEELEEEIKEGINKCRITRVLETEEDARQIIYDVTRMRREVNRLNVINEVIYRNFGVLKDANNLPHYRSNEIVLESKKLDTLDLFVDLYGEEKFRFFRDINRTLIPWAFGDGCIKAFNYAQYKLNKIDEYRIGGKKLKDVHIFVHSARTLGILYKNGATVYQKRLGVLHDVVEEMRKWRIEQRKKAEEEKKAQLQFEIENPPEYDEIYSLFVKRRGKNLEDAIDKTEAELMVYHQRLVTRWLKESYEQYIERMVDGCYNEAVIKKVESLTSNREEQIGFYTTPFIVKSADAIDNTIRVREGDIDDKESRFERNLEILKGIDTSLIRYPHLKSQRLTNLRKELIDSSFDELKSIEQQFQEDRYAYAHSIFQRFREMYGIYGGIKTADANVK